MMKRKYIQRLDFMYTVSHWYNLSEAYIYIYIYIYVCVCVCVLCKNNSSEIVKIESSTWWLTLL